jgi:hypothetical protein
MSEIEKFARAALVNCKVCGKPSASMTSFCCLDCLRAQGPKWIDHLCQSIEGKEGPVTW